MEKRKEEPYSRWGLCCSCCLPSRICRFPWQSPKSPLWARVFEVVGEIPFTTLTIAACANEIDKLEQSKSAVATLWSLISGMIGTVFMAGSVFAVTHEPPIYWLCVLLAVPGFLGWTFPYFVYRHKVMSQTKKMQPIIEAKQDEIYEICKKGHDLL